MDGQLVGEVPALGHPDGVDLADEIGDRGVGRRQLLAVSLAAVDPGHRRSSPASATRSLANRETGWNGSSLISECATIGSHSSSRPTSERIMRVLAWPRSPRRMMSCPASRAFSSWGSTVSSNPGPRPPAARPRRSGPRRCAGSRRPPGSSVQPGLAQPPERGDVGGRGPPDGGGRGGLRVLAGGSGLRVLWGVACAGDPEGRGSTCGRAVRGFARGPAVMER